MSRKFFLGNLRKFGAPQAKIFTYSILKEKLDTDREEEEEEGRRIAAAKGAAVRTLDMDREEEEEHVTIPCCYVLLHV